MTQLTASDVQLMQRLAQRITAARPELINSDASYGELAWNWGRAHAEHSAGWARRMWFEGGELAAWGWAQLPRRVRRSDGSLRDIAGAYLAFQVDPDHAELVDEVIAWFDEAADGLDRTVLPGEADKFGLDRWAAHGYEADPSATWTQLNERALTEVATPELPAGFRFRTAAEVGPKAAFQAHTDAWGVLSYPFESYAGLWETPSYRKDLHVLVEAPDGTLAASAIMWLDEANRTVEFEPVGTHVGYRRQGLAEALLLHGMTRARAAGATHATVACVGAEDDPAARELYYGVGFRRISRDVPLRKTAGNSAE